jgi:CheY-like chemotaxis protein
MAETPTPREAFDNLVRDALHSLYDPARLEDHPLVALLGVERTADSTRGEVLRYLLREAVDRLMPESAIGAGTPTWLTYRVLQLYYLRCLSHNAVCTELGISEATFYRYKRSGLEAVASVLWSRYQAPQGGKVSALAVERAIGLVSEAGRESVDLMRALENALLLIQPLAIDRQVTLKIQPRAESYLTWAAPTLLCQIITNTLAEAVKCSRGRTLSISLQAQEGITLIRIAGVASDVRQPQQKEQGAMSISRGLLAIYGGDVQVEDSTSCEVNIDIRLPTAATKQILVIDDDPNVASLYRRYLHDYPCEVLGMRSLSSVDDLVSTSLPAVILLDVIMPTRDGWALLRELRGNQHTASVPIVVCSVIEQPDLALALGATAVLTKPFSSEILVQTLRPWLLDRDTVAIDRSISS